MKYFHITHKPLTVDSFKDIDQFPKKATHPKGMYCTKYVDLFIDLIWSDTCKSMDSCFLYSIDIPKSMFTTDVHHRPQPEKILKVTKSNWKHVSDYMRSHTIHDMHRDFAGLDADDKRLHVYFKRLMFSRKYLVANWNKSHQRPEFENMFPFGFSALKFDTATNPETCVWRGHQWIRMKLENDKYSPYSPYSPSSTRHPPRSVPNDPNDPIVEMDRQWQKTEEFLNSVLETVFEGDADWALGEWVSTRKLRGMYKKLTGNTIGEEFLNMVITDRYYFEFRNGAVFAFGVLLK